MQPISVEMRNAFNTFQNAIPFSLTEEIQENTRWKRYVRRSLDSKVHEKEFQECRDALERHRKENPSHPSFAELYERSGVKKRKHTDVQEFEQNLKIRSILVIWS